jgi:EAL domain-containing protein (putative c-di-GMP-specific phosphodiesterase class I)
LDTAITERLFVENPDYAMNFLEEVRSAGVKVAIDDFGTGYSSLAYLESLPVDIIKLDMEFVHRMEKSQKSLAIAETVIELARKLGMETIAEGVENGEQLKLLKLLGCTYVQGYYLSKPMSEKQIDKLLL